MLCKQDFLRCCTLSTFQKLSALITATQPLVTAVSHLASTDCFTILWINSRGSYRTVSYHTGATHVQYKKDCCLTSNWISDPGCTLVPFVSCVFLVTASHCSRQMLNKLTADASPVRSFHKFYRALCHRRGGLVRCSHKMCAFLYMQKANKQDLLLKVL